MGRPRTDIAPRIVRAARRQFRDAGVDGASLRAIAKAARTSIGMIYYYYPTKDDLFLAVVEETYEKFLLGIEAAVAPDVDVRARLERLYQRVAAVTEDEVEMLRLVVREVLVSSARRDRLVERFMRGHIPLLLRTLGEGTATDVLDAKRHPLVLLLATFALAGPPQLLRRALGARAPLPGAPEGSALATEMLDVLLHGIAARA